MYSILPFRNRLVSRRSTPGSTAPGVAKGGGGGRIQLLTAMLVLIASSSAAAKSDNGLIQAKVAVVGGVCPQHICRSARIVTAALPGAARGRSATHAGLTSSSTSLQPPLNITASAPCAASLRTCISCAGVCLNEVSPLAKRSRRKRSTTPVSPRAPSRRSARWPATQRAASTCPVFRPSRRSLGAGGRRSIGFAAKHASATVR